MSSRRSAIAAMMALCVAAQASPARTLSREFLSGTSQLSAPLPMSEFTPPDSGAAPQIQFEGRLRLSRESILGGMRVLHDQYGAAKQAEGAIRYLPEFDFYFVQDGSALIPVERGSVPSTSLYWEFILEPGRVWGDPTDGGFMRAALPFSLQERNANCMHNGVMTFLFDRRTVSRVAYQISAETCAYFKADLWGVLPATYTPAAVNNRAQIVAAYAEEVAARLPVKPIEAIAADYPKVQPRGIGSSEEIAPADMTAFGLVVDGTHYVGGCETRHGPYPFCDVLDLPSYSLAKTLFAGLATMRLEHLYPGLMQRKVSDYVPQCRQARWQGVTFEHALDMATGNYTSPAYQDDEQSAATIDFFLAEDHATKIQIACNEHPHRTPPGTAWVYHTTDTYILGTALSAFAKERYGAGADLYRDILVRPLWHRLKLSPVLDTARRTRDQRGQPFTGWGLTLHRDDIARLARFLTWQRAQIDGTAFLDAKAYAAAMQRDPANRGVTAIDSSFKYNNGFWAHDVSRYIGCGEPVWVPYLVGFGGIVVVLLPNDIVYYYFSDSGTFRWSRAVVEANRIRDLCTAAS